LRKKHGFFVDGWRVSSRKSELGASFPLPVPPTIISVERLQLHIPLTAGALAKRALFKKVRARYRRHSTFLIRRAFGSSFISASVSWTWPVIFPIVLLVRRNPQFRSKIKPSPGRTLPFGRSDGSRSLLRVVLYSRAMPKSLELSTEMMRLPLIFAHKNQ